MIEKQHATTLRWPSGPEYQLPRSMIGGINGNASLAEFNLLRHNLSWPEHNVDEWHNIQKESAATLTLRNSRTKRLIGYMCLRSETERLCMITEAIYDPRSTKTPVFNTMAACAIDVAQQLGYSNAFVKAEPGREATYELWGLQRLNPEYPNSRLFVPTLPDARP